jgi:maltose/moltooligosaccharide transporter
MSTDKAVAGVDVPEQTQRTTKPTISFMQIWNMCFGFLGIQMGFALQNANVSRIFQTLGAEVEDLAILWIAAPLTGLLVQPVVGYLSDKTWNRFGRRRPYFLVGAVLSTIALFFMPHSPYLWVAAGTLWIMDASINIAMEPFRAYVGDNLPNSQRTLGFVVQSFFIGVGSVIASALPWIMTNWLDVPNTAAEGVIPLSVKYSFYVGGGVLFLAVMWTVFSTKEYSPEELERFHGKETKIADYTKNRNQNLSKQALMWFSACALATLGIYLLAGQNHDAQRLYLLTIGGSVYAIFLYVAGYLKKSNKTDNGFYHIIYDLNNLPKAMQQLAVVQFFSWFALFTMWIYTTNAVTSFYYGTTDTTSKLYNEGADWVGILFGGYNLFAALAAFLIPVLANRFSMQKAHCICLFAGAAGFLSMLFFNDPRMLLVSMVGIGIAWASILSMPYAMLSTAIPSNKMGVYMGIFNFFIVIPQLLSAVVLGLIVQQFLDGQAIYAMAMAAVLMMISGLFSLRVKV